MAKVRGVDDTFNIARVLRRMADDPDLSERKAIIDVYGNEGPLRRVQVKLKAMRDEAKFALRRSVADAHAAAWPVWSGTEDGEFGLSARVPGPVADSACLTLTVTVDLGGRGGRGGGLSSNVVVGGAAAGHRPHHGSHEALHALGVTHRAVDGVLGDAWPECAAVHALGHALHMAWLEAGVEGEDLPAEAAAHEAARLGAEGLDRLRELLGHGGGRLLACYADAPEVLLATAAVAGMDPARRSVLLAVSCFAGNDVAVTDADMAAGYVGRPLDFLTGVLEARGLGPGRAPTASDAAWLDAILGRRLLLPVPDATVAALLRARASVDPHRCDADVDAAGLVALVGAATSCPHGDVALDVLMARLASGPDAADGYGTVASRMREAFEGDLHGAVLAATLGVERWCADVARDLLVAGIVEDVAMPRGDPRRAQRFVAGALVTARWLSLLEATARDMVCGGRGLDGLAAAMRRHGRGSLASEPFRLFGSGMSDVVSVLSSPLADADALGTAWRLHAPHLVPRWRVGGREAWADRVREAFHDAGAGKATVVGTFRRGVRGIVGMAGAGLGGEGSPGQAARVTGAAAGR